MRWRCMKEEQGGGNLDAMSLQRARAKRHTSPLAAASLVGQRDAQPADEHSTVSKNFTVGLGRSKGGSAKLL